MATRCAPCVRRHVYSNVSRVVCSTTRVTLSCSRSPGDLMAALILAHVARNPHDLRHAVHCASSSLHAVLRGTAREAGQLGLRKDATAEARCRQCCSRQRANWVAFFCCGSACLHLPVLLAYTYIRFCNTLAVWVMMSHGSIRLSLFCRCCRCFFVATGGLGCRVFG